MLIYWNIGGIEDLVTPFGNCHLRPWLWLFRGLHICSWHAM